MHDHVDLILEDWTRERPDLDPSPMGIFGRVTRIYSLAHRRLEALLSGYDLTPASFDVLANLRRAGAPCRRTPSELASSSMLTSGGMTGRLDKLEQQGLVERIPAPADRRVMYAQRTSEGLSLIDEVVAAHLAQEEKMLAELTSAERDQLALLLGALERSIGAVEIPARHKRDVSPAS
jgi:DNA-binding MarR family transcriptional regulator